MPTKVESRTCFDSFYSGESQREAVKVQPISQKVYQQTNKEILESRRNSFFAEFNVNAKIRNGETKKVKEEFVWNAKCV